MKEEQYKQIIYGVTIALLTTIASIIGSRQDTPPQYLYVSLLFIILISIFLLKYNQISENTKRIQELEDNFKLNEQFKDIYTKLSAHEEAIKWLRKGK